MHFTTIASAAGLIGSCAGLVFDGPMVTGFAAGLAPAPAQITPSIEKRADADAACLRSISSNIQLSGDSELNSALSSSYQYGGRGGQFGYGTSGDAGLCEFTLDASLSSAFSSNFASAGTTYSSLISYLENLNTNCGVDSIPAITFQPFCTQESVTAVFTKSGRNATTATATFSNSQHAPATTIHIGAAATVGARGSMGPAAALAALVGVALML